MTTGVSILTGTIHGRTISLDQEAGFPDGQVVSVTVIPALPPGQGLRSAFGAWSADASELDAFVEQARQSRKQSRSE